MHIDICTRIYIHIYAYIYINIYIESISWFVCTQNSIHQGCSVEIYVSFGIHAYKHI